MEPVMSANRARVYLAGLKGVKKISHYHLLRLVKFCGLTDHEDPYGSGNRCFLQSEIDAWYKERLARGERPSRGPGRPRKSISFADLRVS
jgi:hypothetical protein